MEAYRRYLGIRLEGVRVCGKSRPSVQSTTPGILSPATSARILVISGHLPALFASSAFSEIVRIFEMEEANMEGRKEKREVDDEPEVLGSNESLQACEKAFSPETARSGDTDEPCDDGVG